MVISINNGNLMKHICSRIIRNDKCNIIPKLHIIGYNNSFAYYSIIDFDNGDILFDGRVDIRKQLNNKSYNSRVHVNDVIFQKIRQSYVYLQENISNINEYERMSDITHIWEKD